MNHYKPGHSPIQGCEGLKDSFTLCIYVSKYYLRFWSVDLSVVLISF